MNWLRATTTMTLSAAVILCAAWTSPSSSDDSASGWTIPAAASQEASPLQSSPAVLQKGKGLYQSKCERCHGKEGKGNGPDADRDNPPGDLSDGSRATRNPDGVMFYKVWNGRKSPKMPAFKTELSKDEVWTIIAYAKTLRQSPGTGTPQNDSAR